MVRIISDYSKHRPNDNDCKPIVYEERPLVSDPNRSTLDDLAAGLTDLAGAPPPGAPFDEPAPAKLPSVEEFHFEVASARKLASRFAPAEKPRIKYRRPRYRRTSRIRWGSPDERDDRGDKDLWQPPSPIKAPPGRARGLVWSFFAAILVVTGASAAFGFVQPLNDVLPKRMGAFLSDVSDGLSAGLLGNVDRSAGIAMADASAEPAMGVSIPPQPIAPAAQIPAPKSTMASKSTVASAARPSPISGDSVKVAQAEPTGAAAGQAYELGVTVLKLGAVESAANEFESPQSAPAPARGNSDFQRPLALQQSVKADPLPIPNTPAMANEPVSPAMANEPVSNAARAATTVLSAAQIDRLLARARGFLESGNIAAARLLFQRIAEAGDLRGAKGLGMTYDPRVYARLPVTGLTPDREQAEIWYKKAGENPTFPTARIDVADTPRSQEARSAEWNAACARKYISFEPSTGLYTPHSGGKRPCKLP